MAEHLFLYGTLLPELCPAALRPLMASLERVGAATARGRLHDLGPYPALVPAPEGEVRGVLFQLPSESAALRRLLTTLDRFEGYRPDAEAQSLFVRRRERVIGHDGMAVEAWLYVYNRDPGAAPVVSSGDYLAHRGLGGSGS